MKVQVKYTLVGVLDMDLADYDDDELVDPADYDDYIYSAVRDDVEASSFNVTYEVRGLER